MSQPTRHAREDQFLGALLGAAIGDALGNGLSGVDGQKLAERLTDPLGYGEAGDSNPEGAGAITFRTEVILCLVESLTTNDGRPDPDNMVARMAFLAGGPSRESMSEAMVAGIEEAVEREGQVAASNGTAVELAVATRGIPIGLLHAVGGFDEGIMRREAATVTRLSHAGAAQEALTTAVAAAVVETGRSRSIARIEVEETGPEGELLARLTGAVAGADGFEDGMRAALAIEGDRASVGTIAGSLLGTRFGASGIPQPLIDDLDARIYLSLAAPWFYRTAVMRAGTVFDLRQIP